MTVLHGDRVALRTPTDDDVEALAAIRSTSAVHARWGGDDLAAEVREALADPELELMVIAVDGRTVGGIQWSAESDRMYRHANMDLFVAPASTAGASAPTPCGPWRST